MGLFLSLTSVVGKTRDQVVSSLEKYAQSKDGGLEKANLSFDDDNCSVIQEKNGNTTIVNPNNFLEWDESSEFISRDLNAPVFSFHIHDGDLWMYILFVNGENADQFNPIPRYWDDDISDEEEKGWQGNAETVAKYMKSINAGDIKNYLVQWDLEAEDPPKAYPGDEYSQEDWQLIDFMRKLGLSYPLGDDQKDKGDTYKFWTS